MLLDDLVAHTRVAYFSMEIALRPEIPTYSGGLGLLAGDTMRSAADLDLPVIFITLASRRGYLRQEIDADGHQVDHDDPWNPADWCSPLRAMVAVNLEGRDVWVRPWLYVHTCPLGHKTGILLLDTDLEQNTPADRELTHWLYGKEQAYRLKQEAILGIGGMRVLQALGFTIQTYHLNEGHAALLTVELIKRYRRAARNLAPNDTPYDAGRVREQCVFTTHTPVEAGHDKFPYSLFETVLPDYFDPAALQEYAGETALNMTQLALRLSGFVNGVAKRHAETATDMFPGYKLHAITNGVHVPTWAHPALAELFNTIDPHWGHEPEHLAKADQLSNDSIRQAHRKAKSELINLIAERSGVTMRADVPLIGFARRMTGYKRPDLLFTDLDRLRAIHDKTPFQIVLGGKAHPRDTHGKRLIEELHAYIRQLSDTIPMVFLENYNFGVARPLVTGVDIWLNTPLPPLEASGTSGMKAALNGVLNLSILDGWWLEACIPGVTGWPIGEDNTDGENDVDAEALYQKLETTVLPLYYEDPEHWAWMMKQAVAKIGAYFNSQRMMRRYASEAYLR